MTSGGNNFDYFPENQLTKFGASTHLGGAPAPVAYATDVSYFKVSAFRVRAGTQTLVEADDLFSDSVLRQLVPYHD